METIVNRTFSLVTVETVIDRINIFLYALDNKKKRAKCAIFTEDKKRFSFYVDIENKSFDTILLTQNKDAVRFEYYCEDALLTHFWNQTIE